MTDLTREQIEALLDGTTPRFLIRKHGGYYKPNCQGYTSSAILAGRYTEEDAVNNTHPNGPDGPRDGMTYVSEDAVTDEDFAAYAIMRQQRDDLARQLLATMDALAESARADQAEAAMAAVVERAESHAKSTNGVWQRNLELIADRDELRAAIFGSPDYAADLRNGNFREMAETLHSAQKGGIARAEKAEAERDRLAAANAVLEAKVAGLREAVDEQTKARAQHWLRRTMTAPEDAEVEALCERCGYGAVMDAASRLWARKPYGSGAFYIGGCIGFKSDEEARAALATQEAGT